MTPNDPKTATPTDRAAFNKAIAAIRSDHNMLRSMALSATSKGAISADDAMSLVEAMNTHESAEARLFDLPFVSRPPDTVTSTAARARRRGGEYKSGTYSLPDANAAAALFIDALLTHLAVEDAWLNEEDGHQQERMKTIA
jgi:hypothetical protein